MRWVLLKVNFGASEGITNSLPEAFFIYGKVLRSVFPAQRWNNISVFKPLFFTKVGSGENTSDPLSYKNIPFPFD